MVSSLHENRYSLGFTATGAENGEERAESVKEDSCAFLLTEFGVLTVDTLGGEASCSLCILTGVSQSKAFRVLVNDFLAACKIYVFTVYVTVFL